MEKFYVMEIATGDASVAGKAIYEYESLRLAEAAFHQKLSTAMKSDLYETELVMVINNIGGVEKYEYYKAE